MNFMLRAKDTGQPNIFRILARGFVILGGAFWTIMFFSVNTNASYSNFVYTLPEFERAVMYALIPLVLAVAVFVLGFFYERVAGLVLLLAAVRHARMGSHLQHQHRYRHLAHRLHGAGSADRHLRRALPAGRWQAGVPGVGSEHCRSRLARLMRSLRFALLAAFVATSVVAGAAIAYAEEPPATPVIRQVGTSLRGRPITMVSVGSGPRKVLVIGGIHGNEAGASVADKFAAHLLTTPSLLASGTQVDIVICANPDGRARNRRTNARGVDLNRNFPSSNWRRFSSRLGSSGRRRASEPETRVLVDVLAAGGYAHVIALHSKGGIVDYDGPGGWTLARKVSAASGMRVMKLSRYKRYRGSLGSYVPERYHVPVVTLELNNRTLSRRVAAGLLGGGQLVGLLVVGRASRALVRLGHQRDHLGVLGLAELAVELPHRREPRRHLEHDEPVDERLELVERAL